MNFGVPTEIMADEHRVGLTPTGVVQLVKAGHRVFCQQNCCSGAGYSDGEYREAGAEIVYSAGEAYGRADVVLKIKSPRPEEYGHLREGQMLGAFSHLFLSPISLLTTYVEKEMTILSYEEMVQNGEAPVLMPASEIGGLMMPQIAARYLETQSGGRGKLLMGTASVPSATVSIIGAGVLGYHAARSFHRLGAHVLMLDRNVRRLQQMEEVFCGEINTLMMNEHNLRKVLCFSDVVIGAAHEPGRLAPKLITRDMLKLMAPRSLIIDVAIDQGGICETSRPTTLRDPVCEVDGILHYCVPNLTSNVARTASRAHTNALVPLLLRLFEGDPYDIVLKEPVFSSGTYILKGRIIKEELAAFYEQNRQSLASSQEVS